MTDSFSTAEDTALAFGYGSDARVRGADFDDANVYSRHENYASWRSWRDGWCDVHLYWAKKVHGRWRTRTLPAVREPDLPARHARNGKAEAVLEGEPA